MASKRRARRLSGLLVSLVVVAVGYLTTLQQDSSAPPGAGQESSVAAGMAIETAYRDRVSDLVVETAGVVERLLSDDEEGSRHQRFIVRLPSGHTILVSHNIDLAPRVPLRVGDAVDIRGEYEWTDRGGVLHWTHADPRDRRPGGWIRHAGRVYR